MWDYAALSHAAKLEGGPEALVNRLYAEGMASGRADMYPWVLGALGLGSIITYSVTKGIQYLKRKHEEQAEQTKQRLIDGIRQYDVEYVCVSEPLNFDNS